MKKLFISVAALLLTVCTFAQTSGITGDCTWQLTGTGSNLTLTITGTGEMANYYGYGDVPWSSSQTIIKTLVISEGVTSIGSGAFAWCSGLTSVTIPNSVTSIGSAAFYDCSGLTSVTIPNSVTSIGSSAFSVCSGLTSVTIPNSVTSIGDMAFFYCSGLTSVTIGNSVTSIGDMAFFYCSGLTSVTIGNSVTSIGSYAFYDCSGLTAVTIPNSVTSIGESAFSGCSGLTSVTIPNSVTSIGDEAFSSCSGLTAVTIPNSVTSIGDEAFAWCSGLTSVTNLNPVPQSIDSSVFYYYNFYYDSDSDNFIPIYNVDAVSSDTLYVPAGSLAAYQAANVWKDFGTIIELSAEGNNENGDSTATAISAQNLAALPIYPNPTSDQITITDDQWNAVGAGSARPPIEIYNVNGTLVETRHATSLQGNTINIAHLPAGIYLVKVGNKVAKVVKQ